MACSMVHYLWCRGGNEGWVVWFGFRVFYCGVEGDDGVLMCEKVKGHARRHGE